MSEEEKKRKSFYNQRKNEYTQEYIRQNYKQVVIRLPKEGEVTRETITDAATTAGMSMNAFIVEAVREKMIRKETTLQSRTIVRGNCVVCGKPLTEGLFLCKECQAKNDVLNSMQDMIK